MFKRIRPAGNHIRSHCATDSVNLKDYLPLKRTRFYASGTESLAACIQAAKNYSNKLQPEVIMPAYCCPDLVSAADFAGVRTILVDFEYERPWMNLKSIEKKINSNTIAIIAVNFLGIPERIHQIRKLLVDSSIILIADNAQAFSPQTGTPQYDFCVMSFARGKPVNLLAGGLVISKEMQLLEAMPASNAVKQTTSAHAIQLGKIYLYNTLINPRVYWLTQFTPFLRLGATEYKQLKTIRNHSSTMRENLSCNLSAYIKSAPRTREITRQLTESTISSGLKPLNSLCNINYDERMLRLPVLAETQEQRDYIFRKLDKEGLGVSLMYKNALPNVLGLTSRFVDCEAFPHATNLANRLFTLPLHEDVTDNDVFKISRLL